jgi:hypothetical protein
MAIIWNIPYFQTNPCDKMDWLSTIQTAPRLLGSRTIYHCHQFDGPSEPNEEWHNYQYWQRHLQPSVKPLKYGSQLGYCTPDGCDSYPSTAVTQSKRITQEWCTVWRNMTKCQYASWPLNKFTFGAFGAASIYSETRTIFLLSMPSRSTCRFIWKRNPLKVLEASTTSLKV